ncbi:MAG: sigma-70 family RNA polymerase sigma factor [Phycisphaerae bacterium]
MGRRQRAADFLALLDPHKDSLARYAHRSAWRPADAPDILQDTVTTAWREFHRFRIGTNFRAWVFKIMVHMVYKANRRHGLERGAVRVEDLEIEDVSLEREDAWQSVLASPERVMQGLDERLLEALRALGVDERQCLLLRLIEGFTYREISDLLDVPLGTVMSHVHRARIALRERLATLAIERRLVKGATG